VIASFLQVLFEQLKLRMDTGEPDDGPAVPVAVVPDEVLAELEAAPGSVLRVRFEVIAPGDSPAEDLVVFAVEGNGEVH
jgi:hypothetical protein